MMKIKINLDNVMKYNRLIYTVNLTYFKSSKFRVRKRNILGMSDFNKFLTEFWVCFIQEKFATQIRRNVRAMRVCVRAVC